MRQPGLMLILVVLVSILAGSLGPQVKTAAAEESWQYHLAQANNFYLNRLYPKALEELRVVVADPEGGKQLKAWELVIQIAGKLKELDVLIWGLENGRSLAKGRQAAEMQGQLYRLKRVYGRLIFEVEGGSGKLPNRAIALKAKEEISDPGVKSYYDKAVTKFEQEGYSVGSTYLPAGDYLLDGGPVKIVAGKDTKIEVAPTTDITLAVEVAGLGGGRFGDAITGAAGGIGGLDLRVGPHIRFSSGAALLIQAGPILFLGAQSTIDIQQDGFTAHNSARVSVGGSLMVGMEFRLGKVDLAPRIGYAVQYLASGLYFQGSVVSSPEVEPAVPAAILRGEYIVPALGHGPRLGIQAMLSPALNERGKRVPRLFMGVHAGPVWAVPLWGDVAPGASVDGYPQTTVRSTNSDPNAESLKDGPFVFSSVNAGEEGRLSALVFVDVQFVVGLQFRL